MNAPITPEQTEAFIAICEEAINEGNEPGCGVFTTDNTGFFAPFTFDDKSESPHILDLFDSVESEFLIEQDGYEDFYVSRK